MNFKLKAIVAAAAGLLALSGQSHAAIQTSIAPNGVGSPPGANGELFLNVFDPVTELSYTRDLGIHMNDFLANATPIDSLTGRLVAPTTSTAWAIGSTPTPGAGSVVAPGYKLTFAIDPLFTQTFGTGLNEGSYWNIMAGDRSGVNRYLSTANMTVDPSATMANMTNSRVNSLNVMDLMLSDTNSLGTHEPFNDFSINGSNQADPSKGNAYVDNFIRNNWNTKANWDTSAAVGESAHFYMLNATSLNANAKGKVTAYENDFGKATWTLANDGTLTYMAPVPEAETWAMFAAGLLAIGAVARRRMA